MQLIFFVPQNEELEGTLHPQKFGCTLKNEGKRVHVPLDEKPVGMMYLYKPKTNQNHVFTRNEMLIVTH
jgi:hypothetical protein